MAELPGYVYDESQFITTDDSIIKWHMTDDNEIDYTVYTEEDGGRLELPKDATVIKIEMLLEERIC